MTLCFTVFGVAQPMGSKRAFIPKGWARPVVTDSNRSLKSWQQLVMDATAQAILALPPTERRLLQDGVRLTVVFYLPRPKSAPKRITAHTTAPDLDKLVRALGDALTGVVYRDDAQIVDLVALKRYAALGAVPSVEIRVEPSTTVVPFAAMAPLFEVPA